MALSCATARDVHKTIMDKNLEMIEVVAPANFKTRNSDPGS